MIPVTLTLNNFLSYGEEVPPLDFSRFRVACLCGDNGHGKSALLDAITWAIWGEARKAVGERKPDDGLLRVGTQAMRVELVFDLEGDRYRIIRQYKKTNRGQSNLEFQLYDDQADHYVSLTEPSMAATQRRINEVLRMDYQAFINSAFIVQGRVDEFTKKSARERKQILAEILGLSRYDSLAQLARQHYQETEQASINVAQQIERSEQELARKPDYLKQIQTLEKQLQTLNQTITETEQALLKAREQRIALQNARRQASEIRQRLTQLEEEITTAEHQVHDAQNQVQELATLLQQGDHIRADWQRYQVLRAEEASSAEKNDTLRRLENRQRELDKAITAARHQVEQRKNQLEAQLNQAHQTITETDTVLAQQKTIEEGYQRLQKGRKTDQTWEDKRNRLEELEQQRQKVQKTVEQAGEKLRIQLATRQSRYAELQRQAAALPEAHNALQEAKTRVEKQRHLEEERSVTMNRGTTLKGQVETLQAQRTQFEQTLQDLQQKLDLLHHTDEAHCPLCQASLDERRRATLQKKLNQDLKTVQAKISTIDDQIQVHQQRRQQLRDRYQEIQHELTTLVNAPRLLAEAENTHNQLLKAKQELAALAKTIEHFQTELERGSFAREATAVLTQIEKQIQTLGYDRDKHRAIKTRLHQLQHFEGDQARLDAARIQHDKAAALIPTLEKERQKIETILEWKGYAEQEQVEMAELLEQIEQLAYDPKIHRQIKQQLEALLHIPAQKEKLEQAEQRIDQARNTLHQLRRGLDQRITERQNRQTELAKCQNETARLVQLDTEITRLEQTLQQTRSQKESVLQDQGAYRSKLQACTRLEEEKVQLSKQWQTLQREKQIYEKLTIAFGKDGIQALIIENAIPEIEDEANEILSRLTDNRTQVTIEPLRDLKGGGTKETLDIKISDELGTRSYELYSGGEAFRINFALRIALSKLLVQRTGTRLRTLIIDEGFGTQDVPGLDQMIQSIQKISDDFDKILVVTHLETLKNAFPARIEVVKYPDLGSRYQVIT